MNRCSDSAMLVAQAAKRGIAAWISTQRLGGLTMPVSAPRPFVVWPVPNRYVNPSAYFAGAQPDQRTVPGQQAWTAPGPGWQNIGLLGLIQAYPNPQPTPVQVVAPGY